MKAGWTEVALGEIFDLDLDSVSVDPSVSYDMVGVLSYGRGLFGKPSVSGAETSYKTFFRLNNGQIVLSQLFGWEGAIAPVTPDFVGCYVSSQFPTFRPKANLDYGFARWLIRNSQIWEQLRSAAKGMGDRRRTLSPEIFFGATIPLPPFVEQQRIVAHLSAIEGRLDRIQKLREKARFESEALTSSLHFRLAGDRQVKMEQLLFLDEEQVSIEPDGSYPQAGIRSFGMGMFTKLAVTGSDTSYRTFNILRPGKFVMSQVKGWEGAIAVVSDDLNGWFVSPEYRTFSCIDTECDPDYLSLLVTTTWFQTQLASATRGVGARRERVRPEKFLALKMPFPTIDKQKNAVKVLKNSDAVRRSRLKSLTSEDALLPSIIDRVFSG